MKSSSGQSNVSVRFLPAGRQGHAPRCGARNDNKKRSMPFDRAFLLHVGLLGVAPRSYPPQGQILLLYYNPPKTISVKRGTHFVLADALMHLAQALTFFPEGNMAH